MAKSSDCDFCGETIARGQASVSIPRLSLRLHLPCYDRALEVPRTTTPGYRRWSLARALGELPPQSRAS